MIRAKITPKIEGDLVKISVEWIDVIDNNPGEVISKEEFKTSAKAGSSYVTRVGFKEGEQSPATFWLNAEGKRHFILDADAANQKLIGV